MGTITPETGCIYPTINSHDHQLYETQIGIPSNIAMVKNYLFTMLGDPAFPLNVMDAIQVGSDLRNVIHHYHIYLSEGMLEFADRAGRQAIEQSIFLRQEAIKGVNIIEHEWVAVRIAANAAGQKAIVESAKAAAWSVSSPTEVVAWAVAEYGNSDIITVSEKFLELLRSVPS